MITVRPFHDFEFDRACQIQEFTEPEQCEKYRSRFADSGQWADHYFNIAIDVDGVAVGELQVRHCRLSMPPGTAEIGIRILPDFQGRGVGTEVLHLCRAKFFDQGFHRLSGATDVTNLGMARAFEKAGWTFEGVSRALMPGTDGVPHDYRVYATTIWDEM